ncbi:cupredoxin domain-containing protein [Moritella sp. Urea-trap-13]|uniref:cupredoxin domain-containing protein n=1 Tax=Moritella sp. Urea-trap-13 TaxID=2058327 RepID=UPI000C336BE7|nr:cupredoxin domain-containing protein [Moritella sp. Urea-trap-13]PKH06165.1 plastocyanin [Moritella sp. Urea-trap-13]
MMLVNIAGFLLIAAIVWWFWLYKPKQAALGEDALVIIVENGTYQPSHIRLSSDQAATLTFLRKDESPCAATLLFPDMEISENLPLNQPVTIALPPMPAGEYPFHCQMQMYRGQLKIE